MRSFVHSLADLISRHPVSFSFCLFVLGCLISVFAADIRRFLDVRPRQFRKLLFVARAAFYRVRIESLDQAHENTYGLLLRVLEPVVSALALIGTVVVLHFLLTIDPVVLHRPYRRWEQIGELILSLASGFVAGRLLSLGDLLRRLASYDKSREKLVAKAAKCLAKLGVPYEEGLAFVGSHERGIMSRDIRLTDTGSATAQPSAK